MGEWRAAYDFQLWHFCIHYFTMADNIVMNFGGIDEFPTSRTNQANKNPSYLGREQKKDEQSKKSEKKIN